MKRFKITAICMSFLAVPMIGCVAPISGYNSGMHRSSYVSNSTVYESGCDPCGQIESDCGEVITSCMPMTGFSNAVNCRTAFSHLGNGMILVGRGVLDVAAAPFVTVGGMLSSGCRYEVLAHCNSGYLSSPCYQTVEPCEPSCTGCDSCTNGYTEGIQYNVPQNQVTTMMPPAPRRTNSVIQTNPVIQASYKEPTAPVAKFVQPR